MAAEGMLQYMATLNRSLLQWGRGRMAAEGYEASKRQQGWPLLQWGRGRMAAEGRSCTWSPIRCLRFNGAAAGWPRKASCGPQARKPP